MKIKTITCHNVYNYGADLQEYALITYLSRQGHDVEAINYKPPYLSNHFKLWIVANPRWARNFLLKWLYLLLKLPGRLKQLKRKNNFDAFALKYIRATSYIYRSNEDLKKNLPVANAYICGSDQIWNSLFENGKDPAFYLDFVPDDKLKIAYAASFAIDTIADNLKPFVKEKVKRLDFISVRETSGLRILQDIGVQNAIQVLDPVFLLSAQDWKSEFVKPFDERYIFVYDCENNQHIKQIACASAQRHGFKIYTVDKKNNYADKSFYNEAPDVFLSLIYSAQFIITNSFHALAFSLIFNKKFIVLNRTEKINTRMQDLMAMTGLSDLLLQTGQNKALEDINIDYGFVNAFLRNAIEKSEDFLKDALRNNSGLNESKY